MARRYYQLPSFTGLNTFEACARLGSFTAAASELGVTLGAVSRQIKSLESDLNCSLFDRHHRGVELTAEGREFFPLLSHSFEQIGSHCRRLRNRADGSDVTIAATTAFASLWLMPRLGQFWQQFRHINVNHAISDNPADAGFNSADLRIRYGIGSWQFEKSVKLFDDRIYPVCGVEFARRHRLDKPDQILKLPLLRLDSLDPAWTGWDNWLGQWGFDLSSARFRRFNNYVVALQAAEDNQGVALGWHSQVADLIERGRLARLGDDEIVAPGSYYLTWDDRRPLSSGAENLRDWLVRMGSGVRLRGEADGSPAS